MTFAIGLVLFIIGAVASWGGPAGREYGDFVVWLFAVIVTVLGFLMMRPTLLVFLT